MAGEDLFEVSVEMVDGDYTSKIVVAKCSLLERQEDTAKAAFRLLTRNIDHQKKEASNG